MCGIAGYFGSEPPPAERVERCLHLMHRRGPDCGGCLPIHDAGGPSGRAAPLAAVDHRSRRAGQSALPRRLAGAGLQRRTLQLCRATARADRTGQAISDGERYRSSTPDAGRHWNRRPRSLRRNVGLCRSSTRRMARCLLCRDRFGEKPLYLFRDASRAVFRLGDQVPGRTPRQTVRRQRRASLSVSRQRLQGALQGPRHVLSRRAPSFRRRPCSASTPRVGETSRRYWTPTFAPDDGLGYRDASTPSARDSSARSNCGCGRTCRWPSA